MLTDVIMFFFFFCVLEAVDRDGLCGPCAVSHCICLFLPVTAVSLYTPPVISSITETRAADDMLLNISLQPEHFKHFI